MVISGIDYFVSLRTSADNKSLIYYPERLTFYETRQHFGWTHPNLRWRGAKQLRWD